MLMSLLSYKTETETETETEPETEPEPEQAQHKHKDITTLLTNVFSSPYSLSKSFLKKLNVNTMDTSVPMESENAPDAVSSNAKQRITPEIGVDIESVSRVSTCISIVHLMRQNR